MLYFNQLPLTTTTDYAGNSVSVTNILERVEIIPKLLKNPLLFYAYDIQDGDTPDIIANKYYSDPYRYWTVMFANQMFDYEGDWPMDQNLFNVYLVDKYTNDTANSLNVPANTVTPAMVSAYTQSTIQQYIKTVTTVDSSTNNSNTVYYVIDQDSYNTTVQGTQTLPFNTGAFVTITTFAYPQSIFDYEVETNEAKRSINLINSSYIGAVESQLSSLLSK